MSTNWKDVVGTVAPGLASAVGGPLAGLAVGMIGKVFGLDSATTEQVAQAVSGATSADLLKLKEAELDFQKQMRELDVDLERIAASDRDSARVREAAVKDKTPQTLAFLIVGGYMLVQWFILTHVIPTEMRDLVMRMLGVLDAALGMVLSYFFGSSSSSRTKDETIKSLSAE